MKKLFLSAVFVFGVLSYVNAQEFHILPEQTNPNQVLDDVKSVGDVHDESIDSNDEYDSVWDKYKEISNDSDRSLGNRMASGIISWDTILDYLVYLVRFLSQLGLLIGAVMIIYAGYQYATDIFGGDASKGQTAIKYAIIGVVVLSFSYAIMRILTNAFIE